ncbi:MAG: NAD-dependent epimerase/dehydratase family protein [Sphingobacteriaceae bacterium]|nr:MAG: NAD-dependent epimerase/dehydratase family protein [Sphingobacteriaceae bacterium]
MKFIVTGSLGNISKPLTQELVQQGHEVTVISSSPERQADIEALGATAAIGSVENVNFLTATFNSADAVYCMIPPANYFDQTLDLPAYTRKVADNYAQAIQAAGVKRVVFLSSIGAHLSEGNGIIQVYHEVEEIISQLPNTATTFMRPTSFYYNLLGYVSMIKNAGSIFVNYGEEKIIWVSPKDIAAAIAEELQTPSGKTVRYVASDERTGPETAAVLGAAIGKPGLKWIVVADEQVQNGLEAIGMQPSIAAGLVQMYASCRSGDFWEDYYQHKPAELGKVKLEDFAKDFAVAYQNDQVRDH